MNASRSHIDWRAAWVLFCVVTSSLLLIAAGPVPIGDGKLTTDLNGNNFGVTNLSSVVSTNFVGNGASLTNLNAAELRSGTLPTARFPTSLPTIDGAAITNLNASELRSGTIPNARFPGSLPTINGSAITNLNASELRSGTLPNARLDSRVAYVGTSGSDAAVGSYAAPLATLGAALTNLNFEGQIILKGGDYTGAKLNLASARNLRIAAEPGTRVRVYLGEAVTNLTLHSGATYKAAASTVPDAGLLYVFEQGTSQFAIATNVSHPLQKSRLFRLDNYKLTKASDVADVNTGNGRWFVTGGELYVRASDGGNPSAKTFYIPSPTANQSFVYGGTRETHLTIEGVEVYYGVNCFDVSGCGSYKLVDCIAYGASNEGVIATDTQWGEEVRCEYAANSNDGMGAQNNTGPSAATSRDSYFLVKDAWAHDNGDEGHSLHTRCRATYIGGLFDSNANGGITPAQGAEVTIYGATTKNNFIGIQFAVNPSVGEGQTTGALYDCVSDADTYGLSNSADGRIISYRHLFIDPGTTAVATAGGNGIIDLYDCRHYGTGNDVGGGGTINRYNSNFNGGDFALEATSATIEYSPTSGQALVINFPSGVQNTSVFRLHNSLTDFDFGYNGSANSQISTSRSMALACVGTFVSMATENVTRYIFEKDKITVEGSTGDANQGFMLWPSFTADRNWTWQDLSGTVLLDANIGTTIQGYYAYLQSLGTTATTGLFVTAGGGLTATRTITGTAGEITVTNGDGVSGDPTIELPSTITQATTFSASTTFDEAIQVTTSSGAPVVARRAGLTNGSGGQPLAQFVTSSAASPGSYVNIGFITGNYLADAPAEFGLAGFGTVLGTLKFNSKTVTIGGAFGLETPGLYCSAALITTPASVSLTADNQAVSTTDRSLIVLSSDDATATNRTATLSAGADGQILRVRWSGVNAGEIVDTGNAKLSATWTPDADDILTLISDGTNWYETSRSAN